MEPYIDPQPARKRGMPVIKIIATVLLACVIICGGLVTYVAYQFPKWMPALARGPLVAMIEKTSLPEVQKTAIKQNINRIADAYQQGRMSNSQLRAVMTNLMKGPFSELVATESMRYRYANVHSAMDDERRQTMLAFDRLQHGITEKSIPEQKLMQLLRMIPDPDQPKSGQNRGTASEAELKPFLDAMRKTVDEAKIPAEPFQPDFAAEIDKAVTTVLGPNSTSRPADSLPAERMPG